MSGTGDSAADGAAAAGAAADGVADRPADRPAAAGARLLDVVAVVDRLRSPGGCPWDAAATHASLAPYLLEEAYETADALADGDLTHLREELGDVLVQVVLHARLAAEHAEGDRFDIDDVAGDLVAKLIRRHPHVFGSERADTPAAVETAWQQRKQAEKGRRSVTEGVPIGQPALALAAALQARAADVGLPAALVADPPLRAELERLVAAAPGSAEAGVGDLLFAAVALARALGVDPEAALRQRSRGFRDRLAAAEHATVEAGGDPRRLGDEGWHSRWRGAGTAGAAAGAPPN